MLKYIINGGRVLRGDISAGGSKNAVLPILSAVILNRGVTRIHNCPDISDVRITLNILRSLGCRVDLTGSTAEIDASDIIFSKIRAKDACKCRSSITFLGALLSRTGKAETAYPGGCSIGKRPIDIHENALRDMGINVIGSASCIQAERTDRTSGGSVFLRFPSVGATENTLLAAAGSSGTTHIYGAASEPEIVCLAEYLMTIGSEIQGAGTGHITVRGRESYENDNVDYTVCPDRIETATYLMAAAAAGSGVRIHGCSPAHILPVIDVLCEMGCEIETDGDDNTITLVRGAMHGRLESPGIVIADAYPSYPTDAQPLILPLLAAAKGVSFVADRIFPERFSCANELRKMGARFSVSKYGLTVKGRRSLKSADVISRDLRAGAAMIIAGLSACGRTTVTGGFIGRGYGSLCEKLRGIGAEIREVPYQNLS